MRHSTILLAESRGGRLSFAACWLAGGIEARDHGSEWSRTPRQCSVTAQFEARGVYFVCCRCQKKERGGLKLRLRWALHSQTGLAASYAKYNLSKPACYLYTIEAREGQQNEEEVKSTFKRAGPARLCTIRSSTTGHLFSPRNSIRHTHQCRLHLTLREAIKLVISR